MEFSKEAEVWLKAGFISVLADSAIPDKQMTDKMIIVFFMMLPFDIKSTGSAKLYLFISLESIADFKAL